MRAGDDALKKSLERVSVERLEDYLEVLKQTYGSDGIAFDNTFSTLAERQGGTLPTQLQELEAFLARRYENGKG